MIDLLLKASLTSTVFLLGMMFIQWLCYSKENEPKWFSYLGGCIVFLTAGLWAVYALTLIWA